MVWNGSTLPNIYVIARWGGSLSGFTYVVENTSENYTLGFTKGGRFVKIKNLKEILIGCDSGGTNYFSSFYSLAAGSGSIVITGR